MRKILLLILVSQTVFSQKIVDLTATLANIERGMIINGNDYSIDEQVIINTESLNFIKPAYVTFYNVLLNVNSSVKGRGKFNLEGSSRIYIKNKDNNIASSKLVSNKPFGAEFDLDKCTLFKGISKGTSYKIWYTNGTLCKKGVVGDGAKIKRMHYNIKLGKRFMDKQFFTD